MATRKSERKYQTRIVGKVLTKKWSDGVESVYDLEKVPNSTFADLAIHGATQKLGDQHAGWPGFVKARALNDELYAAWCRGEFSIKERDAEAAVLASMPFGDMAAALIEAGNPSEKVKVAEKVWAKLDGKGRKIFLAIPGVRDALADKLAPPTSQSLDDIIGEGDGESEGA